MPRAPKKIITGKPAGRPTTPIPWDTVDHLLECGCSGTEIAATIGMSSDTLYDRTLLEKGIPYSEYSYEKKQKGERHLREVQFEVATKDKDRTMLIWLGKQRLGQREPDKEKLSADDLKFVLEVVDYKQKAKEEAKETKE